MLHNTRPELTVFDSDNRERMTRPGTTSTTLPSTTTTPISPNKSLMADMLEHGDRYDIAHYYTSYHINYYTGEGILTDADMLEHPWSADMWELTMVLFL